jgi:hypothetical protein
MLTREVVPPPTLPPPSCRFTIVVHVVNVVVIGVVNGRDFFVTVPPLPSAVLFSPPSSLQCTNVPPPTQTPLSCPFAIFVRVVDVVVIGGNLFSHSPPPALGPPLIVLEEWGERACRPYHRWVHQWVSTFPFPSSGGN